MDISNKKKVVLGVVVTVILGAVGSGLWEVVFSPAMSWVGRQILTLATLGLDSARDDIYREAAKGHHEKASFYIYLFVAFVLFLMPLVPLPFLLREKKELDRVEQERSLEILQERIDFLNRKMNRLRKVAIGLLLFGSLDSSMLLVRASMGAYVNSVITDFNQNVMIVAPFISIEEERKIRSDFARMQNKQDYLKVTEALHRVAQTNRLDLPKFSIW